MVRDIQKEVFDLIEAQKVEWDLAAKNYEGLQSVKERKIQLSGGAEFKVQFNPERIVSSVAKVDKKSIQERPCFLCASNRPSVQTGVDYEQYELLINPFPIFNKHLTVPIKAHEDQLILPHFSTLLDVVVELDEFTLFYNGPKCGASAPDHFHFQAANKGVMPIEQDFNEGNFTQLAAQLDVLKIFVWKNYHRGIITLQANSKSAVEKGFVALYNQLKLIQPEENEPMLNVLAYFEEGNWIVHCLPRIKHRPDCYFKEGDEKLLTSPASVDLAGVFITPREEDFNKLTASKLETILNEVCMSEREIEEVVEQVSDKWYE